MGKGPNYKPDEIEQCLTALALCHGNAVQARELLKANPVGLSRIPHQKSLENLAVSNAERYAEIQELVAPQIEKTTITGWRSAMAQAVEGIDEAIERTRNNMDDLDARDAASVARNLSIVAGVATDKLMLMTDRPTSRIEGPDIQGDIKELARSLGLIQEGTAEEITDAEVVDEDKQITA